MLIMRSHYSTRTPKRLFVVMMVVVSCVNLYNLISSARVRPEYDDDLFGNTTTNVDAITSPIRVGEDCNKNETKCQYFRPVKFVSQWERTHPKVSNFGTAPLHRCYRNMVHIFSLECNANHLADGRCHIPHAQKTALANSNTTGAEMLDLPAKFVFKKLFKTGGTALDNELRHRIQKMDKKIFRPIKENEGTMAKPHYFMGEVTQSQSMGIDYPVVAVVRNPIERFVSAANQLINMKQRLDSCKRDKIQNNSTHMISCAVDALVNGHQDPHFESLVADMHCNAGDGRHDVQFSLYSMPDVAELLTAFGSRNSIEKTNSSIKKSIVLSISDMDSKMILKVCQWYAADVAMMKSLGFAVPHCL